MTEKLSFRGKVADNLVALMILFILLGFVLSLLAWIVFPVLTSHSYWIRLGIGAVAVLFIAPIAWIVTREGSGVKISFTFLLVISVVGCSLFSVGALGVANSLADNNPTVQRSAQVIGKKHLNEQRNSHPYRLVVRSWLQTTPSLEVIVDRDLFYKTNAGHTVIVIEGPGLFGWPHVIDVEPYSKQ